MKASERGEVWLVDLGMAAKVRPALVLSVPAGETDRALVTLIPHTTSLRGSRFEVALQVPFLRAGAFDAQGLVTIPHAKLLLPLGRLQPGQLAEIETRVLASGSITRIRNRNSMATRRDRNTRTGVAWNAAALTLTGHNWATSRQTVRVASAVFPLPTTLASRGV
ncbi:MAG: type II toxin-antitoxin system PemK/MazF family toxin [Acidobacteria bacterium]|nr:type II toxin-antitoxin system PemK/MazF family toxin [Acidobacteriota bacterium]